MNKWCFNRKLFFKLAHSVAVLISKNNIAGIWAIKAPASLLYRVCAGRECKWNFSEENISGVTQFSFKEKTSVWGKEQISSR